MWAVDARTGREVWHFSGRRAAAIHIGNRGVGIYGNWLYFLTPDNYFVSLDVATGKERWHHEIANMKREYFSTNAPIIIGKQVIIGVGGDSLDIPGYLESRDPESGDLVLALEHDAARRASRAPRRGPTKTRCRTAAACRGCPARTIPELNLYYLGTGNPNPVLAGQEPRRRQPLDVLDRRASIRTPASWRGTTR